MILLSAFITGVYCIFLISLIIGFYHIKEFKVKATSAQHCFSIIVPFRNEENNLTNLFQSFEKLNYPRTHYEFLFVDDASTDQSLAQVKHFKQQSKVKVKILNAIRQSASPKKDALTTAIEEAKFEWILTTDADCIAPKNWLQNLDDFIGTHTCDMVVAPVCFKATSSFLDSFQVLDLLSLQGVSLGAFGIKQAFLCNGANLCYRKVLFEELDGFQDNAAIASGDDVFLLQKVVNSENFKAAFLKSLDATVVSKVEPNWKSLIEQRKRWAAKTASYRSIFSKVLALSVFAMNALVILLLALSLVGTFSWSNLGLIVLVKLSIDLILLIESAVFFRQFRPFIWYPLSSLIYPFFTMFVALSSMLTPYQWKGRSFKK